MNYIDLSIIQYI